MVFAVLACVTKKANVTHLSHAFFAMWNNFGDIFLLKFQGVFDLK